MKEEQEKKETLGEVVHILYTSMEEDQVTRTEREEEEVYLATVMIVLMLIILRLTGTVKTVEREMIMTLISGRGEK